MTVLPDDEDEAEFPEDIDLSGYKSAAGAAKKVHSYLQEYAEALGHSPDEVTLERPEEHSSGAWAVTWEGGPYRWATSVTGGESITGAEMPEFGRGEAEITGFYGHSHWQVECGWSFSLEFYD